MSAESTQKSGRVRKCRQLWRKLSTVGRGSQLKSQEPNYENSGKVGNVGFVAFPFPDFPRFLTNPVSWLFPFPVRLAFGCSIQNSKLLKHVFWGFDVSRKAGKDRKSQEKLGNREKSRKARKSQEKLTKLYFVRVSIFLPASWLSLFPDFSRFLTFPAMPDFKRFLTFLTFPGFQGGID